MTYAEAIQFLYSLHWFGAKFRLENTRKLVTSPAGGLLLQPVCSRSSP